MIAGGVPATDIERKMWWRDPADELAWIDNDDLCAVFDVASGETHLLNSLPALLLQHIGQEPRNALQLLEEISDGAASAADSEEAQKTFVALQSLQLAELVEVTPL